MTTTDEPIPAPKSCGLPDPAATSEHDGQWVAVASFCRPPEPQPAFEVIVADELARWADTARQAGLAPDDHVRLERGDEEVTIVISPRLDTAFTPEQTLWRAD